MAKTGETAAHLGPAEQRGATSPLRSVARRMVRRRLSGAAGPFRTESLAYGASRRRTMRLAVLRSCGAVKSRRAAPPHRRAEMRN